MALLDGGGWGGYGALSDHPSEEIRRPVDPRSSRSAQLRQRLRRIEALPYRVDFPSPTPPRAVLPWPAALVDARRRAAAEALARLCCRHLTLHRSACWSGERSAGSGGASEPSRATALSAAGSRR